MCGHLRPVSTHEQGVKKDPNLSLGNGAGVAAGWAGFRLLSGTAALSLIGLVACGGTEGTAAPSNVLLVTVDTLRADRLGCYGYPLETSPNMDRLASEGVRFADCTVQWPKTWPSMASLMTGAYPRTTGVGYDPQRVPETFPLLSELFSDAGFGTGAVVANFNVGRIWGFERGFDRFVQSWEKSWNAKGGGAAFENRPGRVKAHTNATIVTDEALQWLADEGGKAPFFLWLHYIDPHGPYFPPRKYQTLFRKQHASERVAPESLPYYQRQYTSGTKDVIDDLAYYRAMYDRQIRYLDDELGRLLRGLDKLELRGETLVALTADHGESLGEHDYFLDHGRYSYQANAGVPLILNGPGVPRGSVVERPVALIDLPPTLCELLELAPFVSFEGESLVPDVRGSSRQPDVFLESGYIEGETQLVIRRGKWKLIHVRAEQDRSEMTGGEFELYDLDTDPDEERDVAEDHADLVVELHRALATWYAAVEPPAPGESIDFDALSEDSRAMLEALGYLGEDR